MDPKHQYEQGKKEMYFSPFNIGEKFDMTDRTANKSKKELYRCLQKGQTKKPTPKQGSMKAIDPNEA